MSEEVKEMRDDYSYASLTPCAALLSFFLSQSYNRRSKRN